MERRVRVEIKGRNDFWRNAVKVEWNYQFPDRQLVEESPHRYLIPAAWFEDLKKVAGQCFSEALEAPEDLGRRRLFRRILPSSRED
jgi:hypothetical protein